MSLEAMVWVLSGDAPVADVNEYAVLGAMADKADPDGCGTWLSKETIAARVHVSEETVKRCWRNMSRRGLIARGDQLLVRHYRADRRPVVWDLLIPFTWFSNVDRINADRARHGLPPLTAADRPPIAPPPKKAGRADKGKPRPKKKTAADQESSGRGNSQTPRPDDSPEPNGGTTSRRRGNYKSSAGELQDPQNRQSNQSPDPGREAPPVRPSVQEGDAPASESDGRTDGGSGIEGQQGTEPGAGKELPADRTLERTPGVEVLAAIGAEAPEWRIIGPSLRDQGRNATLLLERGFTPQEIRHALLSRPLPQPLTHTVAAVIGGRLRELAMSLPAFGVRPIPEQAGPVLRERCTTLAAERTKDEALERRVMRECATCRAPIGGAGDLCAECSGRPTPRCSSGCGRAVLADGLVCLSCDVPDDVGVCPGHTEPCGRPVISQGLCRHCLIIVEQERAAREAEYEHQVAAAVAAVAAAGGQQGA
ncbi:hypothetical protein ACFWIY_34635 [Streptomyces sioyaensis]|uniref:hypothetical protein n=1 Tax=Streptomyces sioyaensis TaxID=67364 RepID=UPI0036524036